MVFFPNHELELWEYTETDELDSYLEPKKTYTLIKTIPCDFQPMSTAETLKEFGEIRTDTYKVYVDLNEPVTDTMILRISGKPDTYSITGSIITNNHLPIVHHTKLIIQKTRKPVVIG